jgi:hypothetical protein
MDAKITKNISSRKVAQAYMVEFRSVMKLAFALSVLQPQASSIAECTGAKPVIGLLLFCFLLPLFVVALLVICCCCCL